MDENGSLIVYGIRIEVGHGTDMTYRLRASDMSCAYEAQTFLALESRLH